MHYPENLLVKIVNYCIVNDVNGQRFYFCGYGSGDDKGNIWKTNSVLFSSVKSELDATLAEINDPGAKVIPVTFG